MNKLAYLLIALAACLWGIIGLFVQKLYSFGFSSLQIVAIRVITAALILILYGLLVDRSILKIRPLDGKYFIGTGIFSIVFFNFCYFTAIKVMSLSIAAILLYTGPAFVTIFSKVLFKEALTRNKILSLAITFLGCMLVIGILPKADLSISLYGLLIGLGSGLGYGLYSIFGKYALEKYSPLTVTTYTFVFASLALIPTTGLWKLGSVFLQKEVLIWGLGLGIVPTIAAYCLYTVGLSYIESSRAAITTTIEPVIAASVGTIIFGQPITVWQLAGIGLVLFAVVMVQYQKPELTASQNKG